MRHRDDMVRTDQHRNAEGLMFFAEALGKLVGVELHRRHTPESSDGDDQEDALDRQHKSG
jgi:hypothetical protein